MQKRSNARHVAIVAHSYGGVVTLELAKEFESDFINRVFSISLTDSVHQGSALLSQSLSYVKHTAIVKSFNFSVHDENRILNANKRE